MTLKELKESIAVSPNKEWLQNYELVINYPHINYKTTLKGVVNIYEFIIDQAEGYSSITNFPEELDKIRVRFINAKGNLLRLISQESVSKYSWDDNLKDISGNNTGQPIFLYGSPETDFLLKAHREKPDLFPGAYDYLKGDTSRVTTKTYLQGYLLAYEFTSKDFSLIAERKEAEKKSILTTRTNFQAKLGEAEKEVIEYLSRTNQKFDEYAKQIDTIRGEKNKTFDDWFNKISDDFEKFDSDSHKAIKDLENLYQEKLKLEAPAKYWRIRAKKLRRQGFFWLSALVAAIVIALNILLVILNDVSIGTLKEVFQNTGTAIKWSVVVITVISFLAYAIRIFSKLTFSSFHLSRDAEEREQLTYVYLALLEDKGVDQTERHLIIQSLFSRADSGLLKDDAGPTMPGNIIDQVAKRSNG